MEERANVEQEKGDAQGDLEMAVKNGNDKNGTVVNIAEQHDVSVPKQDDGGL